MIESIAIILVGVFLITVLIVLKRNWDPLRGVDLTDDRTNWP